MIQTNQISIESYGNFSVVNITEQVREFVRSSGLRHGQVLVYYKHTTGAVWIGEHEPGIIADLQAMFEKVAPVSQEYLHHLRGYDFNGHAHMRSALMTISVNVPFVDGELLLGTYQEILVLDDQTELGSRQVVLQVMGE